jgi:pimeloyl-ACP methyl ester carboxylesterase
VPPLASTLAALLALGLPTVRADADAPLPASGSSAETASTPPQPTQVVARLYHGQTFVIWLEADALSGERYRVYRHHAPIDAQSLPQATMLYEVWEGSASYWNDYWQCGVLCQQPGQNWEARFSSTMPLPPLAGEVGTPASPTRGMLVWTLAPEDFASGASEYWYAVTTVNAGGRENATSFSASNTFGPITESVADPRPLRIQETVDGNGVIQRVYVQYMDLRDWNPTLSAPNSVYASYGQNLADPAIANSIQYAYSYVVLEPPVQPQDYPLPVVLKLHPYLLDRIAPPEAFTESSSSSLKENYYDYPAIEIRPIDTGSTWWFGFAEDGFDYRDYPDDCSAVDAMAATAPTIVNYTEHRVLRTVYDLLNDPGTFLGKADPERVYVAGHSMGGGGAIALAMRYPQVFSAGYATAAVTDPAHFVDPLDGCPNPLLGWPADPLCYRGFQLDLTFDVAAKWGPPGTGSNPLQHVYPGVCSFQNPPGHVQPVRIQGPGDWADHLAVYDGRPVYDWQDHSDNVGELAEDGIAPLAVRHSSDDHLVNWPFQGAPFYTAVNNANTAWSGLVDDGLDHLVPWWFLGLGPNYAELAGQGPFHGLSAILSETVPGLRLRPDASTWIFPPPLLGFHAYNAEVPLGLASGGAIEWSSSWNPFDGAPVDTPTEWGTTLRSTDGKVHLVDVTPRRAQNFVLTPGAGYNWSAYNRKGKRVACGCVAADKDGLITVRGFTVGPRGRRLVIRPGADPTCLDCILQPSLDPDGGTSNAVQ